MKAKRLYKADAWGMVRDGVLFRSSIRRKRDEVKAQCQNSLGLPPDRLGFKLVKVNLTWRA